MHFKINVDPYFLLIYIAFPSFSFRNNPFHRGKWGIIRHEIQWWEILDFSTTNDPTTLLDSALRYYSFQFYSCHINRKMFERVSHFLCAIQIRRKWVTPTFLFVNFSRTLCRYTFTMEYVCFVEITVLQLFRATSIRLVCLRSFCSYIERHLKINAIKAAWDASGRKYFVALFQTSKLHSLHGTNSRNGLWFYNFSRSNVNAVFTTVVSEMYTAALKT